MVCSNLISCVFVFLCFCVFVFLALFIDLVTDQVQPLSRMLHARADGVVVAVVPGT